jgi:hypothetical protein
LYELEFTKSYEFHGKVEAVTAKGLTVNGEEVKSWMAAITIAYPVDKPEALKTVKVGIESWPPSTTET